MNYQGQLGMTSIHSLSSRINPICWHADLNKYNIVLSEKTKLTFKLINYDPQKNVSHYYLFPSLTIRK